MRRLIVERDRARRAAKRGGGEDPITLYEDQVPDERQSWDGLDLERLMRKMEREAPQTIKMLELYFYTGLTYAEVGEATGVSEATAHRKIRRAKIALREQLGLPRK